MATLALRMSSDWTIHSTRLRARMWGAMERQAIPAPATDKARITTALARSARPCRDFRCAAATRTVWSGSWDTILPLARLRTSLMNSPSLASLSERASGGSSDTTMCVRTLSSNMPQSNSTSNAGSAAHNITYRP